MSVKLNDGVVLLGPVGNPTEDDDCCCDQGAGCTPCALQIQSADFSTIDVTGYNPSSDPEWNGSFCQSSAILYESNTVPVPLSINGADFFQAVIVRTSPGNWAMSIFVNFGAVAIVIWGGTLVNATASGVYTRNSGTSATPPSFTVGACS